MPPSVEIHGRKSPLVKGEKIFVPVKNEMMVEMLHSNSIKEDYPDSNFLARKNGHMMT